MVLENFPAGTRWRWLPEIAKKFVPIRHRRQGGKVVLSQRQNCRNPRRTIRNSMHSVRRAITFKWCSILRELKRSYRRSIFLTTHGYGAGGGRRFVSWSPKPQAATRAGARSPPQGGKNKSAATHLARTCGMKQGVSNWDVAGWGAEGHHGGRCRTHERTSPASGRDLDWTGAITSSGGVRPSAGPGGKAKSGLLAPALADTISRNWP